MSEKIDLSKYVLSEDDEFMNASQRAYFRAKLVAWKNDILREARETLGHLAEESANHPDLADRASSETDRAIELRARDRQRKLISKIDAALQRIEDGTYGYCEETGEPIGLKRLDARPIATLSIEAQERHERREKVYRDESGAAAGRWANRMTNKLRARKSLPCPFSISNFWPEDLRPSAVAGHGKFPEDTRHFLLHVSIR